MPQWFDTVRPVNRILQGPAKTEIWEMEVGANATAAQMVPGRFVIHDTTDGDVKEAGAKADNVIGVLEVKSDMQLADAYAVGDICNVIPRHENARVMVLLISGGGAVAPGSPLVTAANGKAALQAVGAMGGQGTVVAHSLETQDPSSGPDTWCLAVLSDSAEPAAAA